MIAVLPMVSRFLTPLLRLVRLVLLAAIPPLTLTACVTPPVQEMSDARQAIRSAEEVGAVQHSPDAMRVAWDLLREAQAHLEAGAYDDARRYAVDARDSAIRAHQRASAASLTPP